MKENELGKNSEISICNTKYYINKKNSWNISLRKERLLIEDWPLPSILGNVGGWCFNDNIKEESSIVRPYDNNANSSSW